MSQLCRKYLWYHLRKRKYWDTKININFSVVSEGGQDLCSGATLCSALLFKNKTGDYFFNQSEHSRSVCCLICHYKLLTNEAAKINIQPTNPIREQTDKFCVIVIGRAAIMCMHTYRKPIVARDVTCLSFRNYNNKTPTRRSISIFLSVTFW